MSAKIDLRQLPPLNALKGFEATTRRQSVREAADELGARKAKNVLATGAPYLASANPGCTLQVQRVLRETGSAVQAAHPIEILDASIQGKPFPRTRG